MRNSSFLHRFLVVVGLAAVPPVVAQLPAPRVELSFSEATGAASTNSGALGGVASLAETDGFPRFTNLRPVGDFAPANNPGAVDFGTITTGQGGRAIDLTSSGGTLGAFSAFTICGWVNARDLAEGFGGNRIAFALTTPDGPGFDLVQLANGALRLGINQWPDGGGGGGPSSSTGRITRDPNARATNWVFFAVTYDSALASGQVKFYFGRPDQPAALDAARNYARGPLNSSGALTVGNFSAVVAARSETGPTGGSRVFRGLVDELRVFDQALDLAQIRAAQVAPAFIPPDPPPVVVQTVPTPHTVIRQFSQVDVVFSEPVQGVNAADLLINGSPATNLLVVSPEEYVFFFPEPPTGAVAVAWANGHGITDFAASPGAFAGGTWSHTLDPNALTALPWISEFLADNDRGLIDEDGDSSDWIEIYNPGPDAVDLGGWFLTDDATRPGKWRLPAVTVLPDQFLVVFASEKNRTNPAAPLHTNFRLERNGEYLALLAPASNVVSAFAPRYPAQQEDVSYGRDRLSPEFTGYFATPTPGAPNAVTGTGIAPAVRFSHGSGRFIEPFLLTLSTPDTKAVIRYLLVNDAASTANTNVPGSASPVYTGPLLITNSAQVRARAFVPGFLPGPPSSETYIALHTNVLNRASELPLVVVHTLGSGSFNQSAFRPAHLSIYEPRRGRSSFTDEPTITTRAALRVRGNTSASSPKQSWTMELRDEFNQDKDVSLLGLPAESDWVLYGPNNIEPIYIHNPFAYELARRLGHWAPRTRFVELYLNTTGGVVNTNHYHGLYILIEKVKIADGRIDEPRLDPADTNAPAVTGTYLLQQDRLEAGETGPRIPAVQINFSPAPISGGSALTYTEPREAELRLPQRDPQEFYILNYLSNFVNTLNSPAFADPVDGYSKFVEIPPSLDNHLVKVLCLTVDAFNFSSYFYKRRAGKLVFGPIWDFDRSLESNDHRDHDPRVWRSAVSENFDFFNWSWWGRMFQDTNFWQLWVDRYQELRETEFSHARIFGLVDDLVAEVRGVQPRDVARWPSVTTPRMGSYQWEVDHMKDWLTNRLHFMDTNFLARPLLNTPGGRVPPGFVLELTGPAAPAGSEVFFTLDGSDPRLPGGGISPAAQRYTGPMVISANAHVVARSRNLNHRNLVGGPAGNPPASTPWSGPARAVLVVADVPLAISEIMYHPPPAAGGDTNDADNFEFIELLNTGSAPLDLVGVRLTNGIDYIFTPASGVTQLMAGARVVIVRNLAAFQTRYPGLTGVAGEFTGNLDNAGERLTLVGNRGEPILDLEFDDDWHRITDGPGFSLVLVEPAPAPADFGLASSWRPSGLPGGSPGGVDPAPPVLPPVVINEALTHTDAVAGDAVELFNPTAVEVNLGGWFLTDDFGAPRKYRLPPDTRIPAGGYLVLYQSNSFGLGPEGFALGARGDEVFVFSGDAQGELSGHVHGFDFGPQFHGVSFGRHVVSTGRDQFPAQSAPTLGAANSGPRVGPVVISEIHYHPPDIQFPGGSEDNVEDEFIELRNLTGAPVPLFDPDFPTHTWRLRDAVEFEFPPGFSLGAGGRLLVVSFAPTNAALSNAFAARFGLPGGLPVLGPFRGKLDNSSDRVELERPDAPVPPPSPDAGTVPYVLVERVRYADSTPWPVGADGLGPSLQRVGEGAYGNDPANWQAAAPGPGAAYVVGPLPVITLQPRHQTNIAYQTPVFRVEAASASPLRYQWRFNGTPIYGATNPVLTLPVVQPEQAGEYSVVVLNASGSVVSDAAMLTLLIPVQFTLQPTNRAVRPGAPATFTVAVLSMRPPITYQWRHNGRDLPEANAAAFTIPSVGLEHAGTYQCVVTDGVSATNSAEASLLVLVNPFIVVQPLSQDVPMGGTATFSVTVTNTATLPVMFRWRRAGSTTNVQVLHDYTSILTVPNVTNTAAVAYTVVVTNAAQTAGILSATANLRAVPDTDGDGIPDEAEIALGLNPNDGDDASRDPDGDTMTNREEHIAGTDPRDGGSYLKVDRLENTGSATVEFQARAGRTYAVEFSAAPGGPWTTVANVSARTNQHAARVVHRGPGAAKGFYRIATPAGR